jgi:putative Mn2+ efflux pump MntP
MGFTSVLLIAVGLAMDCFAVSLCAGTAVNGRGAKIKTALKMAVLFGVFQSAMTGLGWFAGTAFRGFIESFDYLIAFGLLTFVGAKMLVEAFKQGNKPVDFGSISVLLMLAVATSIDAFAVGISFSVIRMNMLMPVAVIGLASFVLTIIGVEIGNRAGKISGRNAEIVGGLVLVGMGIRILIEHIH